MAENPPRNARNKRRHDYRDKEAELVAFHAVDKVHSENTGYQRWEHQDYRYRGERTHHGVHVVVDDARVCFHCRLKDV